MLHHCARVLFPFQTNKKRFFDGYNVHFKTMQNVYLCNKHNAYCIIV